MTSAQVVQAIEVDTDEVASAPRVTVDDVKMDAGIHRVSPLAATDSKPAGSSRHRGVALAVAVVALLGGTAAIVAASVGSSSTCCGGYDSDEPVLLVPFASCEALISTLQVYPGYNPGTQLRLSDRYGQTGVSIIAFDEPIALAASDGASSARAESGGSSTAATDYSTTNVQVEGIDEADIIKNDGRYIYSVGGSQLVILQAHPPEARAVLSRTDLSANPSAGAGAGVGVEVFAAEEALLSNDGVLLVLAAAQLYDASHGRRFAALMCQTYNVSNPSAPSLLGSVTLEGVLSTARLIGGHAYVALSSAPRLASTPGPVALVDDVMPVTAASAGAPLEPLARCEDVNFVSEVQPRSLLTLASISMGGDTVGTLRSRVTIASGSSYREAAVHANNGSIYVASYNSQWSCSSDCTPGQWWRRCASDCTYQVSSALTAFNVASNGSLTLRATGRVPGYLLSQWAMDEFSGHLRVAYTTNPSAGGARRENAVDVLDAATLARVGRVSGLGRGERIYAVRFAGPLGYMVTFR